MVKDYIEEHFYVSCSVCTRSLNFNKQEITKTKLQDSLVRRGWRQVEIQTPERIYGGLACDFCALEFCNDGIFVKTK